MIIEHKQHSEIQMMLLVLLKELLVILRAPLAQPIKLRLI